MAGLKKGVKLYKHQEDAVGKLMAKDGNILLSHNVGSGKTLSAIAGHERLRADGKGRKALVVTPASLRTNFAEKGIATFTQGRKVVILGNKQEVAQGHGVDLENVPHDADYHVISYEMFRKDPAKVIAATKADTVIYDELHKIKNDQGATFKAIKAARPLHRNFIGLTGSIVSNSPADVVPLVDAMTNGNHRLGKKQQFERKYVDIDGEGRRKLKHERAVRFLLQPHVHHHDTTKDPNSDMPKKILDEVKVEMGSHQADLYRYVMGKLDPLTALKVRMGVSGLQGKDTKDIFAKIIQARQVTNAIHTIDESVDLSRSARESAKVNKLLDDVEEHLGQTNDGQVVIGTQLIKGGIDVLKQGLKDRGIEHATFIGKGNKGVTEETRQEGVKDFNAGKRRAIIISGAGGEGLSLNNTTMVAMLDGHFNPEKVHQMEARGIRSGGQSHRLPKDRQVLVRRYVATVPRSYTQTAKGVMENVSPTAIIGRMTDPKAPIFFNPFKREKSTDEWVYAVAENKDVVNAQLRDQMSKMSCEQELDLMEKNAHALVAEAAFHDELDKLGSMLRKDTQLPFQTGSHFSDKKVLEHYNEALGDKVDALDDMAGALPDEADQATENEHVEALRHYYRQAAKREDATTYKNEADKRRDLAIGLGSAVAVPTIMALPQVMRLGSDLPFAPAIPMAMGALGIGAPLIWSHLRNPTYGTPKAKARRMGRMTDDQMRDLLRGLGTQETVTKTKDYFIE